MAVGARNTTDTTPSVSMFEFIKYHQKYILVNQSAVLMAEEGKRTNYLTINDHKYWRGVIATSWIACEPTIVH